MDKATFDIIKRFKEIEDNIYQKLEDRNMSTSDIDEILDASMEYHDQLLRLGKHSADEECLDKEALIQEPYENIKRYTKLIVVYEYDNGMALCEDTSGSIHLVPQRLLSYYNEEENTESEEID